MFDTVATGFDREAGRKTSWILVSLLKIFYISILICLNYLKDYQMFLPCKTIKFNFGWKRVESFKKAQTVKKVLFFNV